MLSNVMLDQVKCSMFDRCMLSSGPNTIVLTTPGEGCVNMAVYGELDSPPSRPICCGVGTRMVNKASGEANSPELACSIWEKRVWNESEVREFREVKNDRKIRGALFGRVLCISGVFALGVDDREPEVEGMDCAPGNNVRSKSGVDPRELYQELSNTPAGIVASRCALAAAAPALTGNEATSREAEQAYPQARIDGNGRAQK